MRKYKHWLNLIDDNNREQSLKELIEYLENHTEAKVLFYRKTKSMINWTIIMLECNECYSELDLDVNSTGSSLYRYTRKPANIILSKVQLNDWKNRLQERNETMSLAKYLKDNKIDQIGDDQEFIEEEYDAIQTYCENCGYSITNDDLDVIVSRGLEDSFEYWKETYVKDLWEEFGEVPMNPETEEIEQSWKHFLPGTHREKIWYWFEVQFNISVAELMG